MENKIKKAFSSVKADEEMKEDVKDFLYQQINTPENIKKKGFGNRNFFNKGQMYKWSLGIACFVLIIFFSVRLYPTKAEAANITLDGTAKINISLDDNNNVLEITGLNQEGDEVIATLDGILGKDYKEALIIIVDSNAYKECEAQDNMAQVKVECHDENVAKELQSQAQSVCEQHMGNHQNENCYENNNGNCYNQSASSGEINSTATETTAIQYTEYEHEIETHQNAFNENHNYSDIYDKNNSNGAQMQNNGGNAENANSNGAQMQNNGGNAENTNSNGAQMQNNGGNAENTNSNGAQMQNNSDNAENTNSNGAQMQSNAGNSENANSNGAYIEAGNNNNNDSQGTISSVTGSHHGHHGNDNHE